MSDDTRCLIEGCSKPKGSTRGWCPMHYTRWRRHGNHHTVVKSGQKPIPVGERFWAKVNVDGVCWEWEGYRTDDGYGRFTVDGVGRHAHRIAWGLLMGQIPKGMDLDHLCRNHPCVNPDHLEPVTRRVNLLRGFGASGVNARKTHCKNNHPFTVENTYITRRGSRGCRTCKREYERNRQPRNRA